MMRVARAARAPVQRCALRTFAVTSGEDVALNWSLVDDDITPLNNAYRNLSVRGLIQRAKGTHGPNKSLAVAPGDKPGDAAVSAADVAKALSNVEDVFVVDAAVGSFRGSEVLVRAVTDDAGLALSLQHLLVRTGGASTASSGSDHPIKLFHSSTGSPGISASVSDLGATIVATGNVGVEHIQEAITDATHKLMATGEDELNVLPLAANVYVDGKGATTLEIDVSGKGSVSAPKKGNSLYGVHGAVWSHAGIARLFRGAVVDKKAAKTLGAPKAGDVVIGDAVVTSFDEDNLHGHPTSIVFVGAGKKKADAKSLFAKVARSDAEVEKFDALVKKHGVSISTR
eukprot:CAMPEP_0195511038 /NCGR_PEP_ID=MMETSP0794_2-20130614/3498_1 /TAXON_ID=515487 /ORGANISM="Stephanopyxis turris, Strain CCMP 815" /LENGTH=341 /DNA_ID=CAMNT_0040638575 /DNA_START=78 /DNA_END=1103 /DNA_ORIENTATION=-